MGGGRTKNRLKIGLASMAACFHCPSEKVVRGLSLKHLDLILAETSEDVSVCVLQKCGHLGEKMKRRT